MVSAGQFHTVLLRSDGCAVACGGTRRFWKLWRCCGRHSPCQIPPLDKGVSYTQVSAGHKHTVLLRSDGRAVACGDNSRGQCNIPSLDEGVSYTQVSAGVGHTVLLRSDGLAVTCGRNRWGCCDIPPLDEGVSYIQVAAGSAYTVLLRSDGCAVTCGAMLAEFADGFMPYRPSIPRLDEGVSCTQVSAGSQHSALLQSDGRAVAGGRNLFGECDIPDLEDGVSYTQVSAGIKHTVLLRSDGRAVACGDNSWGQCDIPPLDEGVSYIQVAAGSAYTVLLRSDGRATACGKNENGACNIPPLKSWWDRFRSPRNSLRYISDLRQPWARPRGGRILQADFLQEGDVMILICLALDGLEVVRLKTSKSDLAVDISRKLALQLKADLGELRVVLPDGQLLDAVCTADPFVTLATVCAEHGPGWKVMELRLRLECSVFGVFVRDGFIQSHIMSRVCDQNVAVI